MARVERGEPAFVVGGERAGQPVRVDQGARQSARPPEAEAPRVELDAPAGRRARHGLHVLRRGEGFEQSHGLVRLDAVQHRQFGGA